MSTEVYRFRFEQDIPLEEAEMTLHLATFAAEGLFGQARVRLETSYFVDGPRRTISVDGTTEVGAAVVRIFTGLVIREFGEEAFDVCRVGACPAANTEKLAT